MAPAIASTLETPAALAEARGRVHVVWYTDPINVWCWGCEPAIRRLQVCYADSVQLDLVMGGLFEDFGPLREYWARMSGGRWQDSVVAFLSAVATHHRMPMDVTRMMSSVDELRSTWPSCIAVEAARLVSPSHEYPYLRRFREAMYIEGRRSTERSVQVELAREVSLDVGAFERALDDGSAEAAFEKDREACRARGVTGFPTFELQRDSASARLDGWQPWDDFDAALLEFAPDLRPRSVDPTPDGVEALIRRFGMCATLEVAAVIGGTEDEAELLLEELEAKGSVSRREVGTGLFWAAPRAPGSQIRTGAGDAAAP